MVKIVHRYISLALLVFWCLQVLSGIVLVFRWEIEDAMVPGASASAPAVDPAAIGARLDAIARDGGTVAQMWASTIASKRFDIGYTDAAGTERSMRIDGAGQVLRDRDPATLFAGSGIFDTLTGLHVDLLAGDVGQWIVRISGIFLFTNLVLGLKLAWPRVGTWRRSLLTRPKGAPVARWYGWHRVLGLWVVPLVLVTIGAGALLTFEHPLQDALHTPIPTPVGIEPAAVVTTPTAAMITALARFPGATLSAVIMPSEEAPWYRVRLRTGEELLNNWGKTTVFVSATDGHILSDHDARQASTGQSFMYALYPLHTGQVAGTFGRVVVLLTGVWFITMGVFGVRLWLGRRRRAAAAQASIQSTQANAGKA